MFIKIITHTPVRACVRVCVCVCLCVCVSVCANLIKIGKQVTFHFHCYYYSIIIHTFMRVHIKYKWIDTKL